MLTFEFEATLIHWRGPSPYFFAPIPLHLGAEIRSVAKSVSYGWGVIPVEAEIRGTMFRTSLFPKDDTYLLPLKDVVRRATGLTAGDTASVSLHIKPVRP